METGTVQNPVLNLRPRSQWVPITDLRPADSPRVDGASEQYAQELARMDIVFPAIVVHRPTMRVVDGMHRLRAAELRGQQEIEVCYFEGTAEDAFLFAVEANVSYGLPLSLADRRFAAERIVATHPARSDRWIASLTGLAAKTIRAIRARSTAEDPQSNIRIGRDGRVRPLDSEQRVRSAESLLRDNPGMSVRDVARRTGIAPSTALNVRNRVRSALDAEAGPAAPVVPAQRGKESHEVAPVTAASILDRLRADPSLRFKEAGRVLVRWLGMRTIDPTELAPLLDEVPAHCADAIVDLARYNSAAWQQLSERLTER